MRDTRAYMSTRRRSILGTVAVVAAAASDRQALIWPYDALDASGGILNLSSINTNSALSGGSS